MFSKIALCLAVFFCTADHLYAKSKQPISVPGIMNGPDGYFDPQIRVYSTVDSANITLRPNDCKYIFPTNTRGYTAFCHKNCFDNDDECWNWEDNQSDAYSIPCMCAKQTTVCGAGEVTDVIYLGCIKIPNPPAPPIFYDQFPIILVPRIVPVSSKEGNSYKQPKIRVIIETNHDRVVHTFDGDKDTEKPREIFYPDVEGVKFNFMIKTDESKICAAYLGTGDGIDSNTPPKQEECFFYPGPRKPSGLWYSSNGMTISSNPDNINAREILPETVLTAAEQDKCKDKLCKIGDFLGGFICREDNGSGNTQSICNGGALNDDLTCDNGAQLCPNRYILGMGYAQDPTSNMACVDNWEPRPPRYAMTADPENKVFTETRYAFVAYKKVGNIYKRSEDAAIHLEEAEQSLLDSIKHQGLGLYLINGKYYKYEKIKYFCYKNNVEDNHCKVSPTLAIPDNQREDDYRETNLVSLGGEAYFLSEDSGKNEYSKNICGNTLCYIEPNPYAEDLCVFKDPSSCWAFRSHVDQDGKEFTNKILPANPLKSYCDFLKVEAIGGGASGGFSSGIAFSGSSGGYVSVVVPKSELANYNIILANPGLGGKSNNEAGEDTVVYLCKGNSKIRKRGNNQDLIEYYKKIQKKLFNGDEEEFIEKYCKVLITAKGGANNKGIAQSIDPIGSDFKNKLNYIRNFLSVPGRDSYQEYEPNVPKPNITGSSNEEDYYIEYDQVACAISLPIESEDINDASHDPCLQGFDLSDNKKFFGMGGCSSKADGQFFAGSPGAARVTCEKWRN